MDNIPEQFIFGSKKEHFVIKDNIILGINDQMINQLLQRPYHGAIDICFPGCELITGIKCFGFLGYKPEKKHRTNWFNMFDSISSIDLSKMINLQCISKHCFSEIGNTNREFQEINLSCPNLTEIEDNAFENIGQYSKQVKLILNCPNLLTIGSHAFANISDDGRDGYGRNNGNNNFIEKLTLDLSGCTKLREIKYSAFSDYCNRTKIKHAEIILPDNIEIIGRTSFFGVFASSENITINISNKPYLKYIHETSFDINPRLENSTINIIISNCPQLIEIGDMHQIRVIQHANIDIDTCQNLQKIFNIPTELFRYYKSINKLEYLLNEHLLEIAYALHYYLNTRQNILQLAQKDIDYRTQQIQSERQNTQNILNQLQQQVDLQEQIIQEQTKWYLQLKHQVDEYNQQYSREDDQ